MKKITSIFNKHGSADRSGSDTPEATAVRAVRLFCESGAANSGGEEVLHLPPLVDAAESSPAAATAAAYQIRKFLSKDNCNRPHVQYNAIMLVRILADNPGPSFTKNIGEKFRVAIQALLRESKDQSVQQILRETLSSFEANKTHDENLATLLVMCRRELIRSSKAPASNGYRQPAPVEPRSPAAISSSNPLPLMQQPRPIQPIYPSNHERNQLPSPDELISRIEEARNSAKLLIQLTQSTPPSEFFENDLVKEFAERCQAAQRNLQGFMNNTNPAPDEHTFQNLIETCEQLSLALSTHQRAMLAARRIEDAAVPVQRGNSAADLRPPPPPSALQARLEQRSAIPSTSSGYLPPEPASNHLDNQDHVDFSDDPVSPTLPMPEVLEPNYNYGRSPPPNPGTVELPADMPTSPLVDTSSTSPAKVNNQDNRDLASTRPDSLEHTVSHRHSAHGIGVETHALPSEEDNYHQSLNVADDETVTRETPEFWSKLRQQLQQQSRQPPAITTPNNVPYPAGLQELHATPSYVRRQDVAADNVVMSGAVGDVTEKTNTTMKLNATPINHPPDFIYSPISDHSGPSRIPLVPDSVVSVSSSIPSRPITPTSVSTPQQQRPYWEQQRSPKTQAWPTRTSADYEGKGFGDDESVDLDGRAKGRIRDDDPVTPMTPAGAAGWRY